MGCGTNSSQFFQMLVLTLIQVFTLGNLPLIPDACGKYLIFVIPEYSIRGICVIADYLFLFSRFFTHTSCKYSFPILIFLLFELHNSFPIFLVYSIAKFFSYSDLLNFVVLNDIIIHRKRLSRQIVDVREDSRLKSAFSWSSF